MLCFSNTSFHSILDNVWGHKKRLASKIDSYLLLILLFSSGRRIVSISNKPHVTKLRAKSVQTVNKKEKKENIGFKNIAANFYFNKDLYSSKMQNGYFQVGMTQSKSHAMLLKLEVQIRKSELSNELWMIYFL